MKYLPCVWLCKSAQLWEGIWSCFLLGYSPFPSTEICYLSCHRLACITFSTSSCPSLLLHSSINKRNRDTLLPHVLQGFRSLANANALFIPNCFTNHIEMLISEIIHVFYGLFALIGHDRTETMYETRNDSILLWTLAVVWVVWWSVQLLITDRMLPSKHLDIVLYLFPKFQRFIFL